MANGDISAALGFHAATKLSYISLATKPALYKNYAGLPAIPLPAGMPSPDAPALQAVAGDSAPACAPLDLPTLASLLHYSAGLIRRSQLRSAGEVHYRAAASAGALYPIELYVVCGPLPDLEAGVYHYAPDGGCLTLLRRGDFRGQLAEAAGAHEGVAAAPTTLVCSSVFWRSVWKYRTRGYRYCWWDNGTILSNLLAAANSLGQPAQVVAGFVDAEADALLGLDSEREATFCLVPLGRDAELPTASPAADPAGVPHGDPGDERRIVYPESAELHANSCLLTASEVQAWRESGQPSGHAFRAAGETPDQDAPESAPLGQVISKRGSTRRFAREEMPGTHLAALLRASTSLIPADYLGAGGGLIDTYLIVNAVEGVRPGTYFYSPGWGDAPPELQLLQEGEFREEAGHLCFEQALGADASAVAFFMADLDAILSRLGNRGYRAAQLEAGIIGGRMYLCSHALGLGATGMTFFDDAVTAFFSPHAAGKSLMFLVGLGATATPNRVHPFRSRIGVLKDSLARGAGGGGQPVPDWLYA